jgi:AraC-like DNA-binding protein
MANWGAEGMYSPVKDGVEKTVRAVCYTEAPPPDALASIVHCYWELKTEATLAHDFLLHALPDACVNILFNQIDTNICGVTALRTRYEVLNLGRQFHYVGIQLLPGAWTGRQNRDNSTEELFDRYVGAPYQGKLPLIDTSTSMAQLDFAGKQALMTRLAQWLVAEGLAAHNAVVHSVLKHLNRIRSVGDMAAVAVVSPRQLQRTLQRATGFSPHDLLKVLRLQQSFRQHYLDLYADQAHFIHSFRKITGYTPAKFFEKFNV